eukprot:Em0005g977a
MDMEPEQEIENRSVRSGASKRKKRKEQLDEWNRLQTKLPRLLSFGFSNQNEPNHSTFQVGTLETAAAEHQCLDVVNNAHDSVNETEPSATMLAPSNDWQPSDPCSSSQSSRPMDEYVPISMLQAPLDPIISIIHLKTPQPPLLLSMIQQSGQLLITFESIGRCMGPQDATTMMEGCLFCFVCKLFGKSKSALADKGFDDWKHAGVRLREHKHSSEHTSAMLAFRSRRKKIEMIDKSLQIQLRVVQGPQLSKSGPAASLQKLAEHCDFGDTLSDALRDRLVCGMQNGAVQKRLLGKADLTFAKALEVAELEEMATRDEAQLHEALGLNLTPGQGTPILTAARLQRQDREELDDCPEFRLTQLEQIPVTTAVLRNATAKDPVLSRVLEYIGWPADTTEESEIKEENSQLNKAAYYGKQGW